MTLWGMEVIHAITGGLGDSTIYLEVIFASVHEAVVISYYASFLGRR